MAGRRWSKDDDAALCIAIRVFGPYEYEKIAERVQRTEAAVQQRFSKGPASVRRALQEAAKTYREAQVEQEAPVVVPGPYNASQAPEQPSRDKQLETRIIRLREEGRSWSAIGDTVGMKRDKVRSIFAVAVGERLPEEVDLYEVLRPIEMPAPPARPVAYSPATVDVIASDFHWPKSDKQAEAVLLGAIKRLRPETVYLNGDLFDMMAQSRFDKEYRKRFGWTPQDEADAGAKFLHLLEDIVQEWDGKIVMSLGNHEERWWRWLNQVAPALVGMEKAEELLSFRQWFIPAWSRLELREEDTVIMDDLTITHGAIVRAQAGASANAMGRKLMSSVVMGHTHRLGVSMIRVPARGSRGEGVIRTYELGCLADLMPSYAKNPDWTNGFGVLVRDEQAQSWTLEPVPIINGKATISALGGTVCA